MMRDMRSRSQRVAPLLVCVLCLLPSIAPAQQDDAERTASVHAVVSSQQEPAADPFSVAPPGKPFELYSRARLQRVQ
jgi:hypothetical protein